MILSVQSYGAAATRAVGAALAGCARAGDVFLLEGELGAGKTELVKGLAEGLGVDPETPVTSPTYTLLNRYDAPLPLHHFDLYRLATGDTEALGMEEYLYGDGISVIEWPERLGSDVPETRFAVGVSVTGDSTRGIEIRCFGEDCRERMEELHERLKKVLTVSTIPAKHSFSTAVQDDVKEEY